jgi:hypothetical protein
MPQTTCANEPNRESYLAAGGPRQELTKRHEIRIGRIVEPAAAHDEFFAEISDVSNRPAKGAESQLEEHPQNLER